jgi:maltose alpha-D-glucosyltransferase/alpha-amylase
MFTLPGTPVLWYGEEIGMGDDLALEERNSVRTAMQWSDEPNGGFSTAPSEALIRPAIHDTAYGYERVNVAGQRRDPNSLLNWMECAMRTRKECPAFGRGDWHLVDTGNPAVLAHCCSWQDERVLAMHNLSDQACTVTLALGDYPATRLLDLLGDCHYRPLAQDTYRVELEGYSYRWFRLSRTPG